MSELPVCPTCRSAKTYLCATGNTGCNSCGGVFTPAGQRYENLATTAARTHTDVLLGKVEPRLEPPPNPEPGAEHTGPSLGLPNPNAKPKPAPANPAEAAKAKGHAPQAPPKGRPSAPPETIKA